LLARLLQEAILSSQLKNIEFYLEPADNVRLSSLCGPFNENLKQIERRLGVEITHRDNWFKVTGQPVQAKAATDIIKGLYIDTQPVRGEVNEIEPDNVHLAITEANCLEQDAPSVWNEEVYIKTRRGVIKPRNPNQSQYWLIFFVMISVLVLVLQVLVKPTLQLPLLLMH
jgi:phosphate starvation-inducible PhoH-like protein